MASTNVNVNVYACVILLLSKPALIVSEVDSGDHLAANTDVLDPFQNMCQYYAGEYATEYDASYTCCANETLKLPEELFKVKFILPNYQECSKKFKSDIKSDFPTGMVRSLNDSIGYGWNSFLCELQKLSAFKSNKVTFEETMNMITKLYPSTVKTKLQEGTAKCKAIDSEKIEDHLKLQKFMECFREAEYKICHTPHGHDADNEEENIAKLKQLGCPITLGLESPVEYCCKGRSTPYRITEFPAPDETRSSDQATDNCQTSFDEREKELMPAAFNVVTPGTEDGEDHQMHTTWDVLCMAACTMHQKNYTKDMLKLDFEAVAKYFTQGFPSTMQSDILKILQRRKNKEKMFLAMDVDSENSKPMTFEELSAKFNKAEEKEKIQYYCKFVDTISFEERRALHEYCFDEKYGTEWGNEHHSIFVGS